MVPKGCMSFMSLSKVPAAASMLGFAPGMHTTRRGACVFVPPAIGKAMQAMPGRRTRASHRLGGLRGMASKPPPAVIDGGGMLFGEDGKFDEEAAQNFLGSYWQKRCVLIKNAFPFDSPISPDELAGLACEEEVESRVIVNWEGLGKGDKPAWEAKQGPFTAEDFEKLPETHYTLLVQEANRHVPEVNSLLDRFRFIPNWRVDDVMVSYASKGGGVGPHTDSYDVFLVQGMGVREWSISHKTIDANNEDLVIPDINVRVLKNAFKADEKWELSPGDVLYVPPGAPHWGTALTDDCMTFSVGFRAPCIPDTFVEYVQHVTDKMDQYELVRDPDLKVQQEGPGFISKEAVDEMYDRFVEELTGDNGRDRFASWLGAHVTERFRGGEPWEPIPMEEAHSIVKDLGDGVIDSLYQTEGVKFAWRTDDEGVVQLWAGGELFEVPLTGSDVNDDKILEAVTLICGSTEIFNLGPLVTKGSPVVPLVQDMVEQGFLYVPLEEEEGVDEVEE